MPKFIIGYQNEGDELILENLNEYATKEEAAFEACEWCEVEATTVEEAKELYEETFKKWQENQQQITIEAFLKGQQDQKPAN